MGSPRPGATLAIAAGRPPVLLAVPPLWRECSCSVRAELTLSR